MNKTEHLLTCLIEECAEVQKEATKALRFGLHNGEIMHDDKRKGDIDNSERIAYEIGDLLGIIEMLEENLIPVLNKAELAEKKKERVLKYMQYAIERGVLTED